MDSPANRDIRQAYLIIYGVKGRDRKEKRHHVKIGTVWPDTPDIPAEVVARAKDALKDFKTYDAQRSTLHWDALAKARAEKAKLKGGRL